VGSRARLVPALIRPAALAPWAIVALALTGCATGSGIGTSTEKPPPRQKPTGRDVQVGVASWYGKPHHGRVTASGDVFNMHALTAAHPTLPLGSRVLVTNVKNGRSVEVLINDRGPIIPGRIIDLSYAAARKLDAVDDGTFQVRIRMLRAGQAPDGRDRRRSAADD
jgi:rare lipoprotein A (peptidoglycan hydrolase)